MNKIPGNIILLTSLLIIIFSCQQEPKDYLEENSGQISERMQWWEEARFGMFIHWGLYAVPAGEWKGETNHAEWIRTTAEIPLEEYDKLVGDFNPVKYDPEEWVRVAKNAGMKYMVITSKHHDGFCLYNSKYTDFDIKSTPYQDDILKKLANACHKEGIKICWYYSIMDWHHPDYLPRRDWETNRSTKGSDYFEYYTYMKNQLQELVDNYGDIGVLWFDGEWEGTWNEIYGKDLYNYVRNLEPEIIINNRVDIGRSGMAGMTRPGEFAGDFGTPEQEIPATGLAGVYWETCMTMNNHWGYNKNDNNWKSSKDLIQKLADIASKGGNFLLNVGPKPNGQFPKESVERLAEIGDWMNINKDAIYKTQASPFKNLDFGRCTQKIIGENTRLYFHVFDWPENKKLRIPGIYNKPVNSFLLSDKTSEKLDMIRLEDAILITLPSHCPDLVNTVVVLDVKGSLDVSHPPLIRTNNTIFIDLISVNINSERENVDIRYTTDGSMPGIKSNRVEGPIVLKSSATIVARCFRDGKAVSDTALAHVEKVNPMPSFDVNGVVPGLVGEYYEGNWDSLPEFAEITPMKKIDASNFNLGGRLHDDYYAFTFDGLIKIEEDGVYDFFTDSDDGSQLYLDGKLVVDNDGMHGLEEAKGAVPLQKGLHKIKVTYFEKNGGDVLRVYFKGPGFEKKPIPQNLLFKPKSGKK